MKKIICLLMLLQGVLLMAQTETLVTINGKKVQINPNSLNTASNGLTGTAGEVVLGGDLLKPTVITTTSSYTLALKGLQTGSNADNVLVVDSNGILKWVLRSDFTGDNLGNHTATQDLNMSSKNITAATNITAAGKTATQTAQIKAGTDASVPAAGSIAVSADTSGNVVWKTPASVISANQSQADWSMATTTDPSYIKNKPTIPAPDNLGNHTATQDLNMSSKNITAATNITATGTVTTVNAAVTTKTTTQTAQIKAGTDASVPATGSIAVSADTNGNVVWKTPASVISANQSQVDWNMATTTDPSYIKNKPTIPAPDNLGNHTATQDLNMSSKNITAATNITATGTVTTVNAAVTTKTTTQTAQIKAGTDASVPATGSIAVSADTNGNVVWKTPASVVAASQVQSDWSMATTTDPAYIKNKPTIPSPDNLGNHTATQDLNMASNNIIAAKNITATGNVAIGVATATNTLHVKAASDPVRIEGLAVSSNTADVGLVVDANGVVKKGALPPPSRATYTTTSLAPGQSYTVNLTINPAASFFLITTANGCAKNAIASFQSTGNMLVFLGGLGRNLFYTATALNSEGDSFGLKTSGVTSCGAGGGPTQFDFDIQKAGSTLIITNRGDTNLTYTIRQSEF